MQDKPEEQRANKSREVKKGGTKGKKESTSRNFQDLSSAESITSLESIPKKRKRTRTKTSTPSNVHDSFETDTASGWNRPPTYAQTQELINLQRQTVAGMWKIKSQLATHIEQFTGTFFILHLIIVLVNKVFSVN